VTIPAPFLQCGAEYALEVMVRERAYNQTITVVPCKTTA
jgi:hypothetical protein